MPDAVLLKPGPLTPQEFELMKRHTEIGDTLCAPLQSLRGVRQIIRGHHERLDGSGYPDGLRGDEVPLLAQIISIVDVYDALMSRSPVSQGAEQGRSGASAAPGDDAGQVRSPLRRGVPRRHADRQSSPGLLAAARVHLQMRIAAQLLDRNQRRAVPAARRSSAPRSLRALPRPLNHLSELLVPRPRRAARGAGRCRCAA